MMLPQSDDGPVTFTRAFITLFIIIDPVGTLPIFAALTCQATPTSSRRAALRAVMVAGMVLGACAVGGEELFAAIGISMPAFQVSGGLLLLLIAVNMLFAEQQQQQRRDRGHTAHAPQLPSRDNNSETLRLAHVSNDDLAHVHTQSGTRTKESAAAETSELVELDPAVAVFPLAIPTLAGPGSITALLMLCSEVDSFSDQLIVLGATGLVLLLTLFGYLLAPMLTRLIGQSGTKVMTALMGCLLAALASQYILSGVDAFASKRRWDSSGNEASANATVPMSANMTGMDEG